MGDCMVTLGMNRQDLHDGEMKSVLRFEVSTHRRNEEVGRSISREYPVRTSSFESGTRRSELNLTFKPTFNIARCAKTRICFWCSAFGRASRKG
jgi:hypothetical protein